MRDVIRWKHAALLALAILAAGCSSNSKKELPPAELVDFKEEVVLHKQWSRSIGDGQGETYNMLVPAIDGDTIYAADVTGVVVAMDRNTGDVKWKKKLDLPVSGAVGVGYGLVTIGTLKGEIVALDATNGEEKWKARVSSEVLAPPANNGDVVVVQTQDDRLIGLDASTGTQRWLYDSTPAVLTLRGTSAPIVTNRLAVAGLSTGKVVLSTLPTACRCGNSGLRFHRVVRNWSAWSTLTVVCCFPAVHCTSPATRVALRHWTWKAVVSSGSVMLPAMRVSPRVSAAFT